jgi:hypothetical protein
MKCFGSRYLSRGYMFVRISWFNPSSSSNLFTTTTHSRNRMYSRRKFLIPIKEITTTSTGITAKIADLRCALRFIKSWSLVEPYSAIEIVSRADVMVVKNRTLVHIFSTTNFAFDSIFAWKTNNSSGFSRMDSPRFVANLPFSDCKVEALNFCCS